MNPEHHTPSAIPENVPAPETQADLKNIHTGASHIFTMLQSAATLRDKLIDQEQQQTAYQRN